MRVRGRRLAWTTTTALAGWIVVRVAAAGTPPGAATPMPLPEPPPPPFGRVIYRASKVAGMESLGVTMIACRHRDPVPRRFAVQFFDHAGRPVVSFGWPSSPPTPAGKKLVFITDALHFPNREDVLDLKLGHLTLGTARIVSDARVAHCIGKIRMDAGVHAASYRDEIGLVRDGEPLPDLGATWEGPRKRP